MWLTLMAAPELMQVVGCHTGDRGNGHLDSPNSWAAVSGIWVLLLRV